MCRMAVPGSIPRETWEEPGWRIGEHTDVGPQDFGRCEYVAIHYTAAPSTPDQLTAVRDKLRSSQRSYVETRGYSYGYNWVVDREGRIWEVRGDDYRCAANGNTDSNSRGPAICCYVNGADPANEQMVEAVRRIVAYCQEKAGRTLRVIGHRDVRATACPGAGLYSQVQDGTFVPRPEQELDMRLVEPQRIFDTRNVGLPKDEQVLRVAVPGAPKAAFVNITVSNPQKPGYATAWSGVGTRPNVSNVNYSSGDICNTSWVPVAADGTFRIYLHKAAHVIVDLQAVAQ